MVQQSTAYVVIDGIGMRRQSYSENFQQCSTAVSGESIAVSQTSPFDATLFWRQTALDNR